MCYEHELVMQINYSELLYGVSLQCAHVRKSDSEKMRAPTAILMYSPILIENKNAAIA
jgi:hypothetical protein